jgi:hypothetical protein
MDSIPRASHRVWTRRSPVFAVCAAQVFALFRRRARTRAVRIAAEGPSPCRRSAQAAPKLRLAFLPSHRRELSARVHSPDGFRIHAMLPILPPGPRQVPLAEGVGPIQPAPWDHLHSQSSSRRAPRDRAPVRAASANRAALCCSRKRRRPATWRASRRRSLEAWRILVAWTGRMDGL